MNNLFKRFKVNRKGVDYICSDVHGHFSLLEKKLEKEKFNPKVDRVFCLGDLVDRGPESELALKWLDYDWFFSIQGNHERMLIDSVDQSSGHMFSQWYAWGGSWAEALTRDELMLFYERFVNLPVALELNLPDGKRVGLVHAELPDSCDWNDVKQELQKSDKSDVERNLLISDMLWKKSQPYRAGPACIEPVKNIDHVFHGHTIVDFITTHANRTFMDLGSYLNDDIGLIRPLDFV
ncbi:metallophosphoesterase [Marinimicrobium agarilyticum]|uniref:metallophosphoesterase n=1 Tax=Marinimicrobium agarilyticum TaxID=306546 RepID=UPI000687C595|nr:metallophosphoesterase [Marinimicrobium agarilyticum]